MWLLPKEKLCNKLQQLLTYTKSDCKHSCLDILIYLDFSWNQYSVNIWLGQVNRDTSVVQQTMIKYLVY